MIAIAILLALSAEAPSAAVGTAEACKGAYCEQFQQRFPTMAACGVGMQQSLAAWVSALPGDFALQPGWECRPVNQTKV